MSSEPAPSKLQKNLLHGALKDVHYAREKLRGVVLMQRYGGQPDLATACETLNEHLQRIWHLIDGLDHRPQPELAGPLES